MHIQTQFSTLAIENILEKQIQPLRRQLTCLFSNYTVNLASRMNFEQQLNQTFYDSFNKTIPTAIEQRAIREKYIIQSLQYELQKNNFILCRTSDSQNVYYLGSANEFESKCQKFLEEKQLFSYTNKITQKFTEQYHVKDITDFIDSQLQVLHGEKRLTKEHLIQFSTGQLTNLQLPQLYFLPDTISDVQMTVQPHFTTFRYSPINRLVQYLDKLIRPLFESVCQSTTIQNGFDLEEKFSTYIVQDTQPRINLNFATFKIHDLYSNIEYDELIDALHSLLVNPLVIGRHQHLTTEGILGLTRIVLRNNYFRYGNRIYRFLIGAPLNLALTKLLCNIYLHQWQIPLCREIRTKNLFYARFDEHGFFTWRDSYAELQTLFEQLQQTLPENVQLIDHYGTYAHILHCHFENFNGRIHRGLYRDSTEQPFVMPYFPGYHPRLIYRQWYRYMIIRAIGHCHNIDDFHDERRYIEATFLANGYSLNFIEYLWRQLLLHIGVTPREPILFNQTDYSQLSYKIKRYVHAQTLSKPFIPLPSKNKDDDTKKSNKPIQLFYRYDWGSRYEFNKQFFHMWTTIINADPMFKRHGLEIKLSTKHCYLSNALLTRPTLDKNSTE